MNKLQKNIIFYSNYCLHCNNLLNKVSKTALHDNILYICVDDQKIRIPKIITRVPSIYIVQNKKVLIENEIDIWINAQLSEIRNREQQKKMQQPISQQIPSMEGMSQHPSQDYNHQQEPSKQEMQSNQPIQPNNPEPQNDGEISGYHSNEMGSNLSNIYSFLDETGNSSLNHNFSFVGESTTESINTPKDFNDNGSQVKSELDKQYEKLMEARNGDSLSKGIQRI